MRKTPIHPCSWCGSTTGFGFGRIRQVNVPEESNTQATKSLIHSGENAQILKDPASPRRNEVPERPWTHKHAHIHTRGVSGSKFHEDVGQYQQIHSTFNAIASGKESEDHQPKMCAGQGCDQQIQGQKNSGPKCGVNEEILGRLSKLISTHTEFLKMTELRDWF